MASDEDAEVKVLKVWSEFASGTEAARNSGLIIIGKRLLLCDRAAAEGLHGVQGT